MIVRGIKKMFRESRLLMLLYSTCFVAGIIFSSVPAAQAGRADEISNLKRLYDQKRFFELRGAVENYKGRDDARLLFFRGAVANTSYRPKASIAYLRQYIARARKDREWAREAYRLLADNFVKSCRYAEAASTYGTILARFRQGMKPAEIKDYENALAIYSSFSGTPRQTVLVGKDTAVGESTAETGWSVPVEANNQRIVLGLDTGANISLLAESIARKLGVRFLDASVTIGSITSISIRAKLGVLSEMRIGNAVVRNAIFLIMDDRTLTFPDGSMIKGVIGFPVIAGFREITFNSDGTVFIPRRAQAKSGPNMCLDASNILFRGEYANTDFTFVLDTGAARSILYLPFLEAFEKEVKAKYSLRAEKFTGVGGSEEVPAYIVKEFSVKFSGKPAQLPEIRLLTKALTDNGKFYYGNIGQDLIKRFRKMTLHFAPMKIRFE